MPFVLAPFAAYAVHAVCNAYGGAIAYLPSFARGVVEPRVAFLRTEEGGQAVLAFAALSEVMVGAFLPFLAFAFLQGQELFVPQLGDLVLSALRLALRFELLQIEDALLVSFLLLLRFL